jgi:hypothetical protein
LSTREQNSSQRNKLEGEVRRVPLCLLDFKPFSKGSSVEELEDEDAVFKAWVIHKGGGAKQLAQYAVFTGQVDDFTARFKVMYDSISL